MKTKQQFLYWLIIPILLIGITGGAWAQGPYPNTGNDAVCLNSTHSYGVINTTGSTYAWSINLPVGGTITSTGNNTISVLWETSGNYILEVIETNNSGCSFPIASIEVIVNPLPVPLLSGPSPVCLNAIGNVYTTDAGMTNYSWTVAGGTITAGGTTASNTATISWDGVGPYSVSVNYDNANGCSATNPTTLPVTVNTLPAASPIYRN